MPNLLNVNSYHYRRGGSDTVYFEHAALFENIGWRNAFFSMKHPNNFKTPWSKYFVDELEFGNSYSLPKKLLMATKAVYSFEAQNKLKTLLDDFPTDIAHLHCIYHHLSPAILSTLSNNSVPVVMTAHDLKIACPAYKMLNDCGICERCKGGNLVNVVRNRCVRNSLPASVIVWAESTLHSRLNTYRNRVNKIVVPSRFYIDKFIEWGWPREKFTYIPNFIDASQYIPDYKSDNYFLYFGRLAPEKGVTTLMRAVRASGVKLKIAGSGPLEADLKALQNNLQGDIEFLGYRSGPELQSLIRGAKATVLPSEWYENAPMSILESYALGTPVIGARIGGIPEMIVEGETGWTFESGHLDELTSLISRLAKYPNTHLEQAGRAARAYVQDKFSRRGYLDSMLALYAELGVRA